MNDLSTWNLFMVRDLTDRKIFLSYESVIERLQYLIV